MNHMLNKCKVCFGLRREFPVITEAFIFHERWICTPFCAVRRIRYYCFKFLFPECRLFQCISIIYGKRLEVHIMKQHIHSGQVISRTVVLLPVVMSDISETAKAQKKGDGAAGRVVKTAQGGVIASSH